MGGISRGRIAVVAAMLAALVAVVEIAYGASLGDVLLYLAYELVFVVAPGCLVVAALRPDLRGTLNGFAVGWAAGYVLEILAFDLTAALGIRWAFFAYPLVAAGAALLLIPPGRRARVERTPLAPLGERQLVILAATCALAVVYVGISLFGPTRLPGNGSVILNQDASWGISLAADLLNHFPLGDPNVAGQPLVYHYFSAAHMAAASQVTGLGLPLIYLRLFALPMILCIVVGFSAAGQRLFGNATTGTAAAGLTLLVGEIQLDTRLIGVGQVVFLGTLFTLILASPSFVLGTVVLIPLIVLLAERLGSERGTPGEWALVALVAIGAAGAKVTVLPLLGVALVLYAGWGLLRSRRIPHQVIVATAVVVGVELLFYVSQYRGHASGVHLDLSAGYDFIQSMPGISTLKEGAADLLPGFSGRDALLGVLALPVGLLGMFGAQLTGMWLYFRGRTESVPVAGVWLLCVLVAGAVGMAFLVDPDAYSQLYYVFYGAMAGSLLAAAGLVTSWSAAEPRSRRTMLLLLAGFAVGLVLVIAVTLAGFDHGEGLLAPRVLWALYAGLAALLVLVWLVARRTLASRALAPVVVCSCIVAVGLLDAPVDHVIPSLKDRPAVSSARANLTPGLNDALVWIREDTDTDTTIATSYPGPLNFNYAAFSERRLFLGGWAYSDRSREVGFAPVATGEVNPFADRLAVNAAAFTGDPAALDALQAGGVGYLLVDKVNGPQVPPGTLDGIGRVVYENDDATVIEL